MSSKRGRKRNDNLPPNRARDVQRAFRARRAAHLSSLESRVAELEEENSALRVALNLPPASRPTLGKGPTGKDRPRTLDDGSPSYPSSTRSPESESGEMDSPGSTRTNSLSPSAMRPSSRQAQAADTWDHNLLLVDQAEDEQGSGPSYQSHPSVPPSATMSQKISLHYSYTDQMPPNPRQTMGGGGMYVAAQSPHFSEPYGNGAYAPRDAREQYSYSQAQFPSHDSGVHSHSPTSATTNHSQLHHTRDSISAQHGMQYAPRRTHAESHAFRALQHQHAPQLPPHLHNSNDGIRMPPSPVPSDSGPPARRSLQTYGGVDARLHSLS
ncbi:hypothetical protein FIBSPDRAFT_724161 [Athelia psychrophila]|uniref:BZIP domain-containing protein n=1 Tax=Athelia psychrophila TaxID=1759441 RepID=A0A166UN17_9AGAM|nr:hypothetical protein FIBSPDRAFT_724161 [Fibularhizoctonia sp. CBS 109695]